MSNNTNNNSTKMSSEGLVTYIGDKITQGTERAIFSSSRCMFRVPQELRELNPKAYTPRRFAIGPIHSHNKQQSADDIKARCTNFLFDRVADGSPSPLDDKRRALEECVGAMEKGLGKAKEYYSEQDAEKLTVEMLVVDGCFVVEVLYGYYLLDRSCEENGPRNCNGSSKENMIKIDAFFRNPLNRVTLQHDLLLLENQLPLSVIEELFSRTVLHVRKHPPNITLVACVASFFSRILSPVTECVISIGSNNELLPKTSPKTENFHILHLLHSHYLPRQQLKWGGTIEHKLSSARDLDYAGVKFVRGTTGEDLFRINFSVCLIPFRWFRRAHFEIPAFRVDDLTEPVLRNFIAFEQLSTGMTLYFTAYASLMDKLIDNAEDAKVLEDAGAILNDLGSEKELCKLFNKLCTDVVAGDLCLVEPYKKAVEYSNGCWPKAMGYFRRKYLDSPWTFIAFCIGFITFGVTIANFVRSFTR